MKILHHGKIIEKQPKKVTCYKCKSILEYDHTDVVKDPRDGDYVVCPVCKAFIAVK